MICHEGLCPAVEQTCKHVLGSDCLRMPKRHVSLCGTKRRNRGNRGVYLRLAFPYPPAPCAPAEGVLPAANAQACSGGYVRVCVGSGSGLSQSPSVLSVRAQRRLWRVGSSSGVRGGCPGGSDSVVCALRGSLACPWWAPCPCVSVCCLDGTGCGVM